MTVVFLCALFSCEKEDVSPNVDPTSQDNQVEPVSQIGCWQALNPQAYDITIREGYFMVFSNVCKPITQWVSGYDSNDTLLWTSNNSLEYYTVVVNDTLVYGVKGYDSKEYLVRY